MPSLQPVPSVLPTTLLSPRFGDARLFHVRDNAQIPAYIQAREAWINKTATPGNRGGDEFVGRLDYDSKLYALSSAYLTGKDLSTFLEQLESKSKVEATKWVNINGKPTLYYDPSKPGKNDRYAFTYTDLKSFIDSQLPDQAQAPFKTGEAVTSKLGTTYQLVTL